MTIHHFRRITLVAVAFLLVPLGCDSEFLVGIGGPPPAPGGMMGAGGSPPPMEPEVETPPHVTLGWYHDCAALADGTVRCWGSENSTGALGDGTTASHLDPRPVVGLSSVTNVQASYVYTCAQSGDAYWCWGSDIYGQFGDGRSGNGQKSTTPIQAFGGASLKQLALGEYHACALLPDDTVACTGLNSSGQLGDGSTSDHGTLAPVPGVDHVSQVAAGGNFSCALLNNGTVTCWGQNASADICSGPNVMHASPTAVTGVAGARKLAAGTTHVCALMADHTVTCWGQNFYGQLGSPSAGSCPSYEHGPQPVQGLTDVAQVVAGGDHTCALREDGGVVCWGYNKYGQLGDGTTTDRPAPVAVTGLSGVVRLVAGGDETCAIVADGSVLCWGAFPYDAPPPSALHPQPITF